MAMLGLAAEECVEILENFRNGQLGVPDPLLQELAGNFALDAAIDIDSRQIMDLLEMPGPKMVLRGSIPGGCETDFPLTTLLDEVLAKGIDLRSVAGVLLILKKKQSPSMKIFSTIYSCLDELLHPGAEVGSALYEDKSLVNTATFLVVLLGIGTSHDVLERRRTDWQAIAAKSKDLLEQVEIPAFLRSPMATDYKS